MEPSQIINARLNALGTSAFRAKFRLDQKDLAYVRDKGLPVIRQHAADFVATRLAPADLARDGKQTPYRGHPVFPAQHATATCCRGCLAKWHGMPKGAQLDQQQQAYVVDVIMAWISREAS